MVLQRVGPGRCQRKSSKVGAPAQPHAQEAFRSWTDPPPMATAIEPRPLRVPYPHFAMVAIDADGRTQFHSSQSLARDCQMLFVSDVRERLAKYTAGARMDSRELILSQHSQPQYDLLSPHPRKRRRAQGPCCSFDSAEYDEFEDDHAYEELARVPIEIGDDKKLNQFYENAFHTLQQITCRHIAKSYIKAIEPRKQVKHPYNGGRPAAPGEKADPEKTKPKWWPPGVRHREPDHLKKKERVKLLTHIFRQLHKTHGVTAEMLREAALDHHRKIDVPLRREVLDELYRVKEHEEALYRSEIDSNCVIYVLDLESSSKQAEREESVAESQDDQESAATTAPAATTPEPLKSEHVTSTQEVSAPVQQHIQIPHPHDLPAFAFDAKSSTQSGYDYISPTFAPTPVEESQQHPHLGRHWTQMQQQMYGHVEYGTGTTMPIIANSLVHQQPTVVTTESVAAHMQASPIGLPLSDMHALRTQNQNLYEYMPAHMGEITMRAGPLHHPHPFSHTSQQSGAESDPMIPDYK